eukprot:TRINITY_DN13393_c0_g1_i1.p1 TRINITY_DN13393_c0_g1~~TRINITY_DN13393_c0_g1_i1.p1  ORF type:complete len:247 (-),score=35.87 TRINITY_DN13393_c0_g1_i1:66-806(-)
MRSFALEFRHFARSFALLITYLVVLQRSYVSAEENSEVAIVDIYRTGDVVRIECRNSTGDWGPGPICADTGKEMPLAYGLDSFLYCGWFIRNNQEYERLSRIIEQKDVWTCRVPMTPDRRFYIPFTIPLWGVVEGEHFHMDNHMNIVFHADMGHILGVSFYPVRDRFQYAREGSLVTIHGPVRWFRKQGFDAYIKPALAEISAALLNTGIIAGWCMFSSLLTLLFCILTFQYYYRPKLIQRLKKTE